MRMRKLCPNLEREDGLDTVLEVPIPEEMFISGNSRSSRTGCTNMLSWMRSHGDHRAPPSPLGRGSELQLMLGVVGAPLIPLPIQSQHSIKHIREDPIEASMAKYIVHQYIAHNDRTWKKSDVLSTLLENPTLHRTDFKLA